MSIVQVIIETHKHNSHSHRAPQLHGLRLRIRNEIASAPLLLCSFFGGRECWLVVVWCGEVGLSGVEHTPNENDAGALLLLIIAGAFNM